MELSFIVLCALLSIAVSWTRSPFMALMYSVMLYVNSSFVMFMLGFEFFALVNLLVYVGALAVLFLFVVMLLEIPATELRAYQRGWSTLCLGAVLACRLFAFTTDWRPSLPPVTFVSNMESIHSVGHAFYVRYADLLILNSFVLTVALFGALVLAHVRSV
jgi:NADH:ubiquinone oxidoreductase subunit 6 (subunit J)